VCPARIDHLISALQVEATDQRIAGTDESQWLGREAGSAGRTLPIGYVSAIEELRFRRVVKDHPDPNVPRCSWPSWSEAEGGQATKGTGWMPWRQEPMKDVAGCEKLRGVASRR
jgi:hypothetical protein